MVGPGICLFLSRLFPLPANLETCVRQATAIEVSVAMWLFVGELLLCQ